MKLFNSLPLFVVSYIWCICQTSYVIVLIPLILVLIKVDIKNADSSDVTFKKCFKLFLLFYYLTFQLLLKYIILTIIIYMIVSFILLFALPISIEHFLNYPSLTGIAE